MSNTDSKDIRNYLHLYLGCDAWCIPDDEEKSVRRKIGGYVISFAEGYYKKVQPILRPLSDITKDEDEECHKIMFGEFAEKVIEQNIAHYEGEKIRYLLSKHFDLFGLIESGLAIDKTKINHP